MQVEFIGGPKDGEIVFCREKPSDQFICMDIQQTPIDAMHFFNQIKDYPGRSQLYHVYELEETEKRNRFLYRYEGLT
jgi:hypothetical protein